MSDLNDIERSTVNIVGLAVEWALYGASLPLFVIMMKTLLEPLRGKRKQTSTHPVLNKKALALAILLWVLCTVVVVADLVQEVDGFRIHIKTDHQIQISPESYFTRIRRGTELVRGFAYMAITLLADAVVSYRCFVIWKSRPTVAIISWILWVALLSTCIGYAYSVGTIKYESDEEKARIVGWVTAYFATSLAANAVGTGLLAYRIWKIDRESSPFRLRSSPLRSLLRIAIDSGLIYTISLSITIAGFVCKTLWKDVFIDTMPTIICTTFYLMLIRISNSMREHNELPDVESVFNHNDAALRRVSIRASISDETTKSRGRETQTLEKKDLECQTSSDS
ncbi:hypothetical protein L218DRAFT_988368 [Marasmius fiardii PR-910]|nr:hypothetical protein L218DRAFT_988368 [Marasmius fiardii PR-910]